MSLNEAFLVNLFENFILHNDLRLPTRFKHGQTGESDGKKLSSAMNRLFRVVSIPVASPNVPTYESRLTLKDDGLVAEFKRLNYPCSRLVAFYAVEGRCSLFVNKSSASCLR